MARLGNQSSFEVLSQLAGEGGKVRSYRHEIISALGDHPRRQEAVPLFSRILLDDKSFDARNKSAQALGKIADMRTLGDLYAAYERERIWYAKQTILGSIGKIGNPNSIPFLEAQARGAPEDGVRLSAAKALHRIGTPYALDVLRSIARSEANEMVRENVAKWLKSSS
jgi:HEAT repeat protein